MMILRKISPPLVVFRTPSNIFTRPRSTQPKKGFCETEVDVWASKIDTYSDSGDGLVKCPRTNDGTMVATKTLAGIKTEIASIQRVPSYKKSSKKSEESGGSNDIFTVKEPAADP